MRFLLPIPKHFSTRLILMIFLSGITPVIIFGVLINLFSNSLLGRTEQAIEQGQLEQWRRSRTILDHIAENQVRQKALDVALQIELYLKGHPDMTLEDLQNDEVFREIAVQPVGKSGYTAVHESNSTINRFHVSSSVENSNLNTFARELPDFWQIISDGKGGKYAHGPYMWKDQEGVLHEKIMYIVPIGITPMDKTLLSVSATMYKAEFYKAIEAAQNVSQGTTHLLMKTTSNLIVTMRNQGLFLMVFSIAVILLFSIWSGYYLSRAIKKLRLATRAVNQGDFNIQIHHALSGDVGDLIDDFNRMVCNLNTTTVQKEQLEQKEKELQTHRDQLEMLVEKRTNALVHTNNQLINEAEERKQAVLALEEGERRLNAIFQTSPVGIGLAVDRKMQWANDRMYQMVGYEPGCLFGLETKVMYPDIPEYERVGRDLQQQIEAQGVGDITTRLVRKDGTAFDCSMRGSYFNREDPAQGIVIAVTDITDRKQLEEELQRAKKMEAIGTLAGGVAHDLNNILSGLVSYPDLILLELPEGSPLIRPLKVIKQSGEQAAAIVQDLLTMARRGVAIMDTINLNEVISNQLHGPEFEQLKLYHPGIEVSLALAPNLSNIHGSSAHLGKAFMNMLNNAAESMANSGTITITTTNSTLAAPCHGFERIEAGEYVQINITDEGTGIAAEELTKIFEPFYTKKQMGRSGSGLGMAVVWGTVKDHKGFIDVTSEHDEGTTFSLFFPVTDNNVTPGKTAFDIKKFMGTGKSVLIVDDSDTQREIARSIFQKLDYTPYTAASGEEAVSFLKGMEVDIVLLDMVMEPGMDGLDTFLQIIEFKPDQKLIIASGFSENDRVKQIQTLSGCSYLAKPYTIEGISKTAFAELHKT